MVLLNIWTLGQVYEMWSIDRHSMWTAVRIKYLGACFIGNISFIFALIYTGKINIVKKYILVLLTPGSF